MKKLWKRDRKYYLCVVILIMIASFFVAEKVHLMMSKNVLIHNEDAEFAMLYDFELMERDTVLKSLSLYNKCFMGVLESRYIYQHGLKNISISKEEPILSREVYRGKLAKAYQQSIKQAKVYNVESMTEKEESIEIFEKKINQVYAEVVGRTIEQDYISGTKLYSIKWNGENTVESGYNNLIGALFFEASDYASYNALYLFGYDIFHEKVPYEFIAIIVCMVFIFIVQILKWKLLDNHEFELVLPIHKKTRTIYDLLIGVGAISLPSLYFIMKGVIWQIQFSELEFLGAKSQPILVYTVQQMSYFFISCLLIYMTFYLFKQMSHSIVFACVLYMVFVFPMLSLFVYYTPRKVLVIVGLVVSVFLFVLNIWIGVKEEGSNTKLFKYISFQVIMNLYLIGVLFCGSLIGGFYLVEGEILSFMVGFILLLALLMMANLWIYRYDYKQAK